VGKTRTGQRKKKIIMEVLPTTQNKSENRFLTNDDGLFNASSLAKEYGKEVYGYIRSQKIKDFVREISREYKYDPELEFTEKGNIVRVIAGGTAPGTWMHLDIFIKFLGWLNPKLERDFLKIAFAANNKSDADSLQEELAQIEAGITRLKKKLSRNPLYKDLVRKQKAALQLQREIDKQGKNWRKKLSVKTNLLIKSPKP